MLRGFIGDEHFKQSLRVSKKGRHKIIFIALKYTKKKKKTFFVEKREPERLKFRSI
jgi:hypothetical protein